MSFFLPQSHVPGMSEEEQEASPTLFERKTISSRNITLGSRMLLLFDFQGQQFLLWVFSVLTPSFIHCCVFSEPPQEITLH